MEIKENKVRQASKINKLYTLASVVLSHDRSIQHIVLDANPQAVHVRLASRIQVKTVAYNLSRLSEVHIGTVREGLSQNKLLSVDKSVTGV